MDLPDSVSLRAHHQIDARFAVLGDITRNHWSRFDQVVVRFDNPRQPPVVTPKIGKKPFATPSESPTTRNGPVILRSGGA